MTEQLKLTADQRQKVKQVLDATEQKMRMILANTNLSPQELGAMGREVRAANDNQLKGIFTAGQYQQWQKILAQRTIRRRPEAPPGGGSLPKTDSPQTGGGSTQKQ
jgi:Spy/CpxP family protein refolding chaperone